MNDLLPLGIVIVLVLITIYLLFRARARSNQHCPACHRLGCADHYGRYQCSACGAHFILDSTGKPLRTIWEAVLAPLGVNLFCVACLLLMLFTRGERDLIVGAVFVSVLMIIEIRRAFREKRFVCAEDSTGISKAGSSSN